MIETIKQDVQIIRESLKAKTQALKEEHNQRKSNEQQLSESLSLIDDLRTIHTEELEAEKQAAALRSEEMSWLGFHLAYLNMWHTFNLAEQHYETHVSTLKTKIVSSDEQYSKNMTNQESLLSEETEKSFKLQVGSIYLDYVNYT